MRMLNRTYAREAAPPSAGSPLPAWSNSRWWTSSRYTAARIRRSRVPRRGSASAASVTQHGELLGGHLAASFNLGEVGPVIGDAVGQVLLVQPGFLAAAPELLAEANCKQPDRLRVERVRGGLLSLGDVGRWVTWCGVSPTWNRTGCHVTRL